MALATNFGRVVYYNEGFVPIKSPEFLIILSYRITRQTRKTTSPPLYCQTEHGGDLL